MIKAIQTRYKGYHFRSRLEARWAVFFDALGLEWEYEPEGFDLGEAGWYLPDFKVYSTTGCVGWYEIKPKHINIDEKERKFRQIISKKEKETSRLLNGDPVDFLTQYIWSLCPGCGLIGTSAVVGSGDNEKFISCDFCSDISSPSSTFTSKTGMFNGWWPVDVFKGMIAIDEPFFIDVKDFVLRCADKARSARFEHGETPR